MEKYKSRKGMFLISQLSAVIKYEMLLFFVILVALLSVSEAQFYPYYDLEICSGLAENSVIGIKYECFKYYYCNNGVAYLDDCRNVCKGCQFDFKINECNAEMLVKCSPAQIQSNLPVVQTPTQLWLPAIQNLQYLPWLSSSHTQQNQQWMQQQIQEYPKFEQQPISQVEQMIEPAEIPQFQPISEVSQFQPISEVSQFQPIATVEVIESRPERSKEICQLNFTGFHPDRYLHLLCPNISFETNISYNEFSRATEGGVHSKLKCDMKFNCKLQIEISPCVLMNVEIPSKSGFYSQHGVILNSTC
jgi:hypothetical protein